MVEGTGQGDDDADDGGDGLECDCAERRVGECVEDLCASKDVEADCSSAQPVGRDSLRKMLLRRSMIAVASNAMRGIEGKRTAAMSQTSLHSGWSIMNCQRV